MKWMQRSALFCLLLLNYAAAAQLEAGAKKVEKVVFSSINTAGVILGKSDPELSVQTVNGASYKSWFAGIGVGLDYYYLRTIPLFAHVQKRLFPEKNPLFAYADLGMNIPWMKDADKQALWYRSDYKAGLYYDIGAGYELNMKKGAIILSAGYTTKQMQETQTYPYIWGPPGMPDRKEYIDYNLSRLVLKAGFRF